MKLKSIIFVILLLLLLPQLVSAQASLGIEYGTATGLGTQDLPTLIVSIVRVILGFLGILAVILLLYGGFTWMTAAGNEDKVDKAKKILVNAAIGLAIILAAFAIVSYVIKVLSEATGEPPEACLDGETQSCSVASCSGTKTCSSGAFGACIQDDPACDPFSDPNNFRLATTTPNGVVPIRNVQVQLVFNNNPVNLNLDSGYSIENLTDPAATVDTVASISAARRITIRSEMECPAHPGVYCFDANTQYRITVVTTPGDSFQDSYGHSVQCGAPNAPCVFTFTTGDLVDTEDPNVDLDYARDVSVSPAEQYDWLTNNINLPIDGSFLFTASADDDAGLALMSFQEETNPLPMSLGELTPGVAVYTGQSLNNWAPMSMVPPYAVGQTKRITSVVTDYAGNEVEVTRNVRLWPTQCFNNIQDPDEIGYNCGGPCPACGGASCDSDPALNCQPDESLCASNQCDPDSCLCIAGPVITQVDPADGAANNLVTIFGQNFGSTPGRVLFIDPSDPASPIEISLANIPGCINLWQNDQIIVKAPSIANGVYQVQVETAPPDPLLSNSNRQFDLNNTVRPGICLVNPGSGIFEDTFSLRGINFGAGDEVNFGLPASPIPALNISFPPSPPAYDEASAQVANLASGRTSVRVKSGGENSNGLLFNVLGEEDEDLIINYIEPTQGAPGQYVTIHGSGFGSSKGSSLVQVLGSAGYTDGEFNFPNACGTNYWRHDQIIVKVPDMGPALATDKLKVIVGSETAFSPEDFTYNQTLEVTPGICSINPTEGVPGDTVEIAGEPFSGADVNFSNVLVDNADLESSSPNSLSLLVPAGAETGQVTVINNATSSNPVDFIVSGSGDEEEGVIPDYYEWQFTTCADCYVPEVLLSGNCWAFNNASPTPVRWPLYNATSTFPDQDIGLNFSDNVTNFVLNTTVKLFNCGTGPAIGVCNPVSFGPGSTVSEENDTNVVSHTSDYITIDPFDEFALNTWYMVTFTDDIESVEGINLNEDYSWYFKTRDNFGQCTADSVNVLPFNRTEGSPNGPLVLNQNIDYSSYGFNSGNCALCPNNFQWDWTTSRAGQVSLPAPAEHDNRISVRALGLVQQPDEATVSAQITSAAPNPTGSARLNIVPEAPRVDLDNSCEDADMMSPTPRPNYPIACVNAKVGVRFTIPMDLSTFNDANIDILKCTGNICDDDIAGTFEAAGDRSFIFTPDSALLPNTFYEVSLGEGLESANGIGLVGLTHWRFKTKNSSEPCQFDRVMVEPGSLTLLIAETSPYVGLPSDASCQLLVPPAGSEWTWTSELNNRRDDGSAIASVSPDGPDENTVATARDVGTTFIRAELDGVRNSGSNGSLRVSDSPENQLNLIQFQPSGPDACLNAVARATFNKSLDESSITTDNFWIEENGNPMDISLTNNNSRKAISMVPLAAPHRWIAGKNYAVYIQGEGSGIVSDGLFLQQEGCEAFGGQWDDVLKTCHWNFTAADEPCAPANIEMSPTSTVSLVGETDVWQATALADDGTPLSDAMESWNIEDGTVATITSIILPFQSQATTLATSTGQTYIHARLANLEGSGQLTVQAPITGPKVTDINPEDADPNGPLSCRNSLIQIAFDQPLSPQTITSDNIRVQYFIPNNPGICPGVSQEIQWPKKIKIAWMRKAVDVVVNDVFYPLFRKVIKTAKATWAPICDLTNYRLSPVYDNGQTIVSVYPNGALPEIVPDFPNNDNIVVTIQGGDSGIKGENGLNMESSAAYPVVDSQIVYDFNTGHGICSLSRVEASSNLSLPRSGEFTFISSEDVPDDNNSSNPVTFDTNPADFDKAYFASGYSQYDSQIYSIPGVYEWEWRWQSLDTSLAVMGNNPLYYPAGHDNSYRVVQAANKNGETDILLSAVFPPSYSKADITDTARAIIFLCENPWPSYEQTTLLRYEDRQHNFALRYCRDDGQRGEEDDLPSVYDGVITGLPKRDYPTADPAIPADWSVSMLDELMRDYLLVVPGINDAVGVRVYSNYHHLNPSEWYQLNIPADRRGSPVSQSVDGYQAIQDGRSVYIAGTNAKDANFDNIIEEATSNIFLISYNSGADQKVIKIFDQLVEFFKLNINISSNNVKRAITRDTKRLADLVSLQKTMAVYRAQHGDWPALISGSYIPGVSTSKWPSWNETLGQELGASLPVDPVNAFGSCPCTPPPSDPLICTYYDPNTCWNPQLNGGQGQFACSADSYFYRYNALDPEIPNSYYTLHTKMETPYTPGVIWLKIKPMPSLFMRDYSGPAPLLRMILSRHNSYIAGCTP